MDAAHARCTVGTTKADVLRWPNRLSFARILSTMSALCCLQPVWHRWKIPVVGTFRREQCAILLGTLFGTFVGIVRTTSIE